MKGWSERIIFHRNIGDNMVKRGCKEIKICFFAFLCMYQVQNKYKFFFGGSIGSDDCLSRWICYTLKAKKIPCQNEGESLFLSLGFDWDVTLPFMYARNKYQLLIRRLLHRGSFSVIFLFLYLFFLCGNKTTIERMVRVKMGNWFHG